MIKAVIIDDEQHCIDSLAMDLSQYCPDVGVIAQYNTAAAAVTGIQKENPQLVFLDVEMPVMNGFQILEALQQINFCIIFTTAYDKFAARAFRLSAIDYLLKPIDIADLKEAVRKAKEKIDNADGMGNILNLLYNNKRPLLQQKIAFPNRDGYEFVEAARIIYCEADGAYTKVILEEGKKLLISRTLGDIEEMLPSANFQRIHHSFVVNISFVTQFLRNDGGYVILKNGEKLSVSKSKKEALMERLGTK